MTVIDRRHKKKTVRNSKGQLVQEEEETCDSVFKVIGDAVVTPATPPKHMLVFDAVQFDDAAQVKITRDGYLVAKPRVARTGIQEYHGSEFGLADVETVRVYRPPSEVFSKDALQSFAHKPVTINHPPVQVTADNWKQYSVGQIGDDVLRDGETIRVPMVLMDSAAIKAVKEGKNQLSVGYDCELEWKKGKTADGLEYDAVQRNIRANHLAVVAAARGGPLLKIGDDSNGDDTMNLKTVMVDGIECQMTDTAAALVERSLKAQQAVIDTLTVEKTTAEGKVAELATKAATQDAEIATLKSQLVDSKLTPERLDALVRDRQVVVDKAAKILGATFKADGKSVEDMRREAVKAKLGDIAKDWNDDQIKISFDTLTASVSTAGGVQDARAAFAGFTPPPVPQQVQAVDEAYSSYDKSITEAWQKPIGAAH